MTILDPSALGNIDRFRQVNTRATCPDEVLNPSWRPTHDFIRRCLSSFARVDFVNYEDATVYGRVESGVWHYKNASNYPHRHDHQDCLAALGWNEPPTANDLATATVNVASEKQVTIGAWAPRHPHNG